MIGGYAGGPYDPDYTPHWKPADTPATNPEPQPPTANRALAEFEQILAEVDKRAGLLLLIEDLDEQFRRLRPGGSWADFEREAVEKMRSIIWRIRQVAK